MLAIHLLTACHQLAPVNAANWFNKRHAMCYHVYETIHVTDPQLSVVREGDCVLLAGFCLSLQTTCAEQGC